jgi:hypothetical protein
MALQGLRRAVNLGLGKKQDQQIRMVARPSNDWN